MNFLRILALAILVLVYHLKLQLVQQKSSEALRYVLELLTITKMHNIRKVKPLIILSN